MPDVVPYLGFNGNCAEAMRFYERALDGKLELMMSGADSPMAAQVPKEFAHRIMHARLSVPGGATIYAGDAMGQAEGDLGQGNADGAVDSQGRALDALRKGAQGLAQSMQQQLGQGPGPGRNGRLGQPRADQDTDPLGRPLHGRDYGDDTTVKVPGEIDVQRARRIIEELRKRFGDFARPQEELDYIERLLKDY